MTTSVTPEQLEAFALQMEQMGDAAGGKVYRDRAATLRQQRQAAPPAAGSSSGTINADGYVVLEGVDPEKLERGWGSDWHKPSAVPLGAIPGETEGVVWPDQRYVKGAQIWLAFRSTDGNYYRDAIRCAYQTGAVGKLGDTLRALGIPYVVEGKSVKFQFPPGIPCQLIFKDKQGAKGDEIGLTEVLPVTTESL